MGREELHARARPLLSSGATPAPGWRSSDQADVAAISQDTPARRALPQTGIGVPQCTLWVSRCVACTQYLRTPARWHVALDTIGRQPLSASQNVATVAVLGMGGTIAMTRTGAGGVEPALSAGDLVAAVPGLSEVPADIKVIDVRRLPGASLTLDDVRELYAAAASAYAAGVDGAIVTQGTDSIEETAYLLDLWHGGPQPLVVTGAMRNPTQAGPDGPANLLAAIRTTVAPQARNRGVMVVLADQIHAAARVRKTHATSVGAFTSPNGGPLGQLIEERPWFAAPPAVRLTVPLPPPDARHKVGLMLVSLGDQGEMLDGIGDRLDGLVVAGMGVGHVPAPLAPVLQDIAGKMPVVLATRTGAGPVLTATYAFQGSERDLRDRGLIPAGLLDPLKARILLLACLRAGASREAIAASFAVAGGYTDPVAWPWPTAASLSLRSEHPGCLHDAEAALRPASRPRRARWARTPIPRCRPSRTGPQARAPCRRTPRVSRRCRWRRACRRGPSRQSGPSRQAACCCGTRPAAWPPRLPIRFPRAPGRNWASRNRRPARSRRAGVRLPGGDGPT